MEQYLTVSGSDQGGAPRRVEFRYTDEELMTSRNLLSDVDAICRAAFELGLTVQKFRDQATYTNVVVVSWGQEQPA